MSRLTGITCVAQLCFTVAVCPAALCCNVKHDLLSIIYAHVLHPKYQHINEVGVVQVQVKQFFVCSVWLEFVTACLFVMRLKSVCPYQFIGWEEITEQKQWEVLYD